MSMQEILILEKDNGNCFSKNKEKSPDFCGRFALQCSLPWMLEFESWNWFYALMKATYLLEHLCLILHSMFQSVSNFFEICVFILRTCFLSWIKYLAPWYLTSFNATVVVSFFNEFLFLIFFSILHKIQIIIKITI